jgi:lipopolysaccharide biosynthesis regulator YciM
MGWLARAFGGGARDSRDLDSEVCSALLAVFDQNLDRAEEALVRAVRSDADGIESYLALARLYCIRGEIGRAIRVHQNLLLREDLHKEQRLTALADLGADFRQGGFEDRAIACYEDVILDDKRDLKSLRALVQLYAQTGRYSRAIEYSRRLTRLEGSERGDDEARLYAEMAKAQYAEGHHDDARRSTKKALRCAKRCVAAWVLLGDLEAERSRAKAALAAWSEVPRLDRASGPLVYAKLEATYAALGRARDFETFVRGLLEEQPEDSNARRALASVLSARGDIDASISELNLLLGVDSDDLETRAVLGQILLSEGRVSEAAREYGLMIAALSRRGLLGGEEKPD